MTSEKNIQPGTRPRARICMTPPTGCDCDKRPHICPACQAWASQGFQGPWVWPPEIKSHPPLNPDSFYYTLEQDCDRSQVWRVLRNTISGAQAVFSGTREEANAYKAKVESPAPLNPDRCQLFLRVESFGKAKDLRNLVITDELSGHTRTLVAIPRAWAEKLANDNVIFEQPPEDEEQCCRCERPVMPGLAFRFCVHCWERRVREMDTRIVEEDLELDRVYGGD